MLMLPARAAHAETLTRSKSWETVKRCCFSSLAGCVDHARNRPETPYAFCPLPGATAIRRNSSQFGHRTGALHHQCTEQCVDTGRMSLRVRCTTDAINGHRLQTTLGAS